VNIHGAEHDHKFNEFMKRYNKVYAPEEKSRRYANFKASLETIKELNSQGGAVFGITQFADMSPYEFKNTILMQNILGVVDTAPDALLPFSPVSNLSAEFDWRDHGAVSAVKNQGNCGSCWAFSATEALESASILAGKANNSINLSPQQIVDCDHDFVFGCSGGRTSSAFKYLIAAGGQEGMEHYPYVGHGGNKCSFNESFVEASMQAVQADLGKPETTLQTNLATLGPLSICLDAAHWQLYESGVLTARQCCPLVCELDHCVQLVGYNTTATMPYWIIRNSWTTDWGMLGYIFVEMGKNACGITSTVMWPTVAV